TRVACHALARHDLEEAQDGAGRKSVDDGGLRSGRGAGIQTIGSRHGAGPLHLCVPSTACCGIILWRKAPSHDRGVASEPSPEEAAEVYCIAFQGWKCCHRELEIA